jgi:hypothetical protein
MLKQIKKSFNFFKTEETVMDGSEAEDRHCDSQDKEVVL